MDEGFSKCFILCQGINDCFSNLKWIGHRSNANKVIVRFIKEVRRTRLKFLEEHWITFILSLNLLLSWHMAGTQ